MLRAWQRTKLSLPIIGKDISFDLPNDKPLHEIVWPLALQWPLNQAEDHDREIAIMSGQMMFHQ